MIPCTEFIPVYSELFKFLHARGGKQAVVDFWKYLSDNFLRNLKNLVEKEGLRGCWLYWSHTLNEEAADFTMELDEELGEFQITMNYCPSMGLLLKTRHIEPYQAYCEHCDILYRRVLEPLGYEYQFNPPNPGEASCSIVVKKRVEPV